MGTNVDVEKLKKWMKKNGWILIRTNKHESWIFEIIDKNSGDIIKYNSVTINTHRSKGAGVSDDAIKNIANTMEIKKSNLVDMVKNKKNVNLDNYKK